MNKTQFNYKFRFLINVTGSEESILKLDQDFKDTFGDRFEKVFIFSTHVFVKLNPTEKPISRKFFSDKHKGAVMLKARDVKTKSLVDDALIETML
jgi:hypothetical protein